MTTAQPIPSRAVVVVALLGVVLVATSLRTAVASVSPIADQIDADIGFGALALTVVGIVPPVAFAVSGLFTPPLVRRFGLEGTVVAAIAAMILGHLARTFAPDAVVLTIGTVVTLAGVGAANVVLPSIVKRYFPNRIAVMTAVYTTVMSFGTAIPAALAVPVADSAGWRVSLGVWFLLALLAAPPWIALLLSSRRGVPDQAERDAAESLTEARRPIWRSRTAISLGLLFTATSTAVYASFAWLPKLLVDTAGVDAAQAGILLGVMALMGFPFSILAPLIASRVRNITPLALTGVGLLLAGATGLLVAPAAAPLLWVILYGSGPLLFPLVLYLVTARTRTHLTAVAASGFVQTIGYAGGALGPLVVGVLHDLTGGWTAPLIFLLLAAMPGLIASFFLSKPVMIDDELARAR